MARKTDREPLRFQGAPHRLVGSVRLAQDGLTRDALSAAPLSISLDPALGAPLVLPPRVRAADPSVAELKLRLPRTTPPGTYEGSASVAGRQVPVVVEIEGCPRLRAAPPLLSLRAAPGKAVSADVGLANLGNVAVEIADRYTFCVFDATGIDAAFHAALAEDPGPGERRIDRLMDELAPHHGGLVRLDVAAGSGPLGPGEHRACRLELRFSQRLRLGRVYAGAWTLENLRFPIRVEAIRAPDAREEVR